MALQTTDLLAVWRDTAQQNFSVSVSKLMEQVPPAPVPTLTSVLQANNTSQGVALVIQNALSNDVVTLNTETHSIFNNGILTDNTITVGSTSKILLETTGDITASQTILVGDTTTANAIVVYPAGATVGNLTGTPTVTITNAGVATFAGALEAESIDGGIYAA